MSGPDTLDASKQHWYANIRGHDVIVVGEIDGPDRTVGIFGSSFEPQFLFCSDGVRLRALEDQLTDAEWQFITSQVETQMDEDGDDYDDRKVDEALDRRAFGDE